MLVSYFPSKRRSHPSPEDQQRKRIEVVDNIIRHAVQLHRCCLRDQVGRHLSIRQPEKRQEQKHMAGFDATTHLIHPSIVERHPTWLVRLVARLSPVPEIRSRHVLERTNRVKRPAALHGKSVQLHRLDEHIALRRLLDVAAAQPHHQQRAEDEEDRREQIRQPESDVLLGVHHADLPGERSDVDEEVVAHVNSRDSDSGVDNDALAVGLSA
jgi:hypothetical protein